MTEMIERVAKSLARVASERAWLADPNFMDDKWPGGKQAYIEARWTNYADEARAAIEAMRSPTPMMCSAGVNSEHTLEPMGEDYPSKEQSCANIFIAMIDEALNENDIDGKTT